MQIRCIPFGLGSLPLSCFTRPAGAYRVGLSLVVTGIFLLACESRPVARQHTLTGHSGGIYALGWSLDGRRLASGSADGTVRVWDVTTGKAVYSLDVRAGGVSALAWTPQGDRLAVGALDGTVTVWDSQTRQAVRQLLALPGRLSAMSIGVVSMDWSPANAQLVSVSGMALETQAVQWDAETGNAVRVLVENACCAAWSPGGEWIAIGLNDGRLLLLDAQSGDIQATLDGHTEAVSSLCWSGDGSALVSASAGGTVILWDLRAGKALYTWTGHQYRVLEVMFHPSRHALLSAAEDGTLITWDSESGRLLQTLEGYTGWARSMAFRPDGETLASGSEDGTITVWDLP